MSKVNAQRHFNVFLTFISIAQYGYSQHIKNVSQLPGNSSKSHYQEYRAAFQVPLYHSSIWHTGPHHRLSAARSTNPQHSSIFGVDRELVLLIIASQNQHVVAVQPASVLQPYNPFSLQPSRCFFLAAPYSSFHLNSFSSGNSGRYSPHSPPQTRIALSTFRIRACGHSASLSCELATHPARGQCKSFYLLCRQAWALASGCNSIHSASFLQPIIHPFLSLCSVSSCREGAMICRQEKCSAAWFEGPAVRLYL